jgi:uncharacterized membrane protein
MGDGVAEQREIEEEKTMSRRILAFEVLVITAALVAAIVAYPHLPSQIATHWGTQMQPNGYSGRSAVFWLGPGLLTGIMLLTRLGPWLSPARYSVTGFESTWQRLMLLVFCLMAVLFGAMLWAALGHAFDIGQVMAGTVCLFLMFFGNLLSKVRPNFFLGIRTPWTLASEAVWIATHRVAAWATVASGLCGLGLVIAGLPQWSLLPFGVAMVFAAGYSLVLSKQGIGDRAGRSAEN